MSNNYITKSALLFDICHVLIKPQNPTRGPAVSTAQLVAREEPKVSIKGTLPDVKVLTKTRILPVPLSSSTLRIYGMEQPTPVKKPIKESINISSLLTQKHSYRSFQSRAIRGQTSIRYGRKQSPPPAIPSAHLKSCHRRAFLKTTAVSATSTLNKSLTIRYPSNTIFFPAPVK